MRTLFIVISTLPLSLAAWKGRLIKAGYILDQKILLGLAIRLGLPANLLAAPGCGSQGGC
jgi:hypothetical protein